MRIGMISVRRKVRKVLCLECTSNLSAVVGG